MVINAVSMSVFLFFAGESNTTLPFTGTTSTPQTYSDFSPKKITISKKIDVMEKEKGKVSERTLRKEEGGYHSLFFFFMTLSIFIMSDQKQMNGEHILPSICLQRGNRCAELPCIDFASFFPEKRMSKPMRREGEEKIKGGAGNGFSCFKKLRIKGKADRKPASAVEQSIEPVSVDPEKTREGPCLIKFGSERQNSVSIL